MKLHYYPDTDSLYIEFSDRPAVETREVSDGVNVDIDACGNVVGFDIDRVPNSTTVSAMKELDEAKGRRFDSAEELFRALDM